MHRPLTRRLAVVAGWILCAALAIQPGAARAEPLHGPAVLPASQAASTVTILVRSLRVRTGPGTGFPVVDAALAGESYPVLSQTGNCSWLQIQQPDGDALWISGAPVYIQLSTPCADIPAFFADNSPPVEDYFSGALDSVTILVPSLRVRTGPGTEFPIVDSALFNEQYPVLSQTGDCAWLQIRQPDGDELWVSGAEIYVRYANGCNAITGNASTANEPTSEEPTSEESASEEPISEESATDVIETEPLSAADPADGHDVDIFTPTLGCYFFRNLSFVEATVTLTLQPDGQGVDFVVPAGAETLYCLEPGPYTYTLDAPPPYGSLNGEFEAVEGDRAVFPIRTTN